jgi:predicted RND superfamily exporter protein
MWRSLGHFILKYRLLLLIFLLLSTILMGYWASKVQQNYEFGKAIPVDNPKYIEYQAFKKKFGEDGNLLVIGIQTDSLFRENLFNSYTELQRSIAKQEGVEDIISATTALNLVKIEETEKLKADTIFPDRPLSQVEIDSLKSIFFNLPFYRNLI